MTERERMIREMSLAASVKHALARRTIDQLKEALAAVEAIRRGDPGAVGELEVMCCKVIYAGNVFAVPMEDLLAAEDRRRQLENHLEAMDNAEAVTDDMAQDEGR